MVKYNEVAGPNNVRPKRIGIAGYMGAGKTTHAHSFEADGAIIIDADAEAKLLMSRDCQLQCKLKDAFGEAVVDGNNLRFDYLGQAAFKSIESLQTLNGIAHPPLVEHLKRLIFDSDRPPLIILDAALIPLWGIEFWFDKCVWIDTLFETRFERLKTKRSDIDEQELIRRMKMQEKIMPPPDSKLWVKLSEPLCCP